MSELVLVFSLTAVLFSALTAIFSFAAYAKVVGMEKSTHKIQYVEPDGPTGKEFVEKFKKAMYSEYDDHV